MTKSSEDVPHEDVLDLLDDAIERVPKGGSAAIYERELLEVLGAARKEIERLHSWDGLMALMDEHWPREIFPVGDEPAPDVGDPGVRILRLARWVDLLREQLGAGGGCGGATTAWR